MRILLLLLFISIIVSAVYGNESYCQWKVNGKCKICTFNLYLVNGNCVKSCPSGYVPRRPNWVFEAPVMTATFPGDSAKRGVRLSDGGGFGS